MNESGEKEARWYDRDSLNFSIQSWVMKLSYADDLGFWSHCAAVDLEGEKVLSDNA